LNQSTHLRVANSTASKFSPWSAPVDHLGLVETVTTPAVDFVNSFEEYAAKGGLKGGSAGRTASRWRPKVKEFCDFVRHRDLKRIKTSDGYDWVDHLIGKKIPRDSIRKVWIAALSATASFMVERRKLDQNPFLGIRVRDEDASENAEREKLQKEPPRKGFTPQEAKKILTATLVAPSDFISVEMAAARRWLPWLCAYSGARINELTSLYPADIKLYAGGIWCMIIKPSLEKTAQWRSVPIHSHVIEQEFGRKFLDYVEERRKLKKPLFYDPNRRRGGTVRHPQFHKVAERVGEWVHSLGVPIGIKPNHGWRHVFKSMARHVGMDREVEGFITGHRPKDAGSGNDYGDHWVQTMSAEIEKYPRYDIPALNQPPMPHKRRRRTDFDVALAKGRERGTQGGPCRTDAGRLMTPSRHRVNLNYEDHMERPNPNLYYTQPTFRAASPDLAKLRGQTEWTLQTPGIGLRLALDYYRFEAFATKHERDGRCGPTAHQDVRYAPATTKDLRSNDITIDMIACGHDIDHPMFDAVVSPLFDAAFRRLIGEVVGSSKDTEGMIAESEIIIARARYSIKAESVSGWIKFPVSAMAVFEKADRNVMDRTIAWLDNRIQLTASPSLFAPRPN
jgi:integrase